MSPRLLGAAAFALCVGTGCQGRVAPPPPSSGDPAIWIDRSPARPRSAFPIDPGDARVQDQAPPEAPRHELSSPEGVAEIDAGGALSFFALEHGAEVPFTVRTVGIGRGTALPVTGVATSAADGVRIDRGVAQEILKGDEAGILQEWELLDAPAGTGDLVVEVAVEGYDFLEAAAGLLFVGPTGHAMRYGNATWVDAAGRLADLPMRWDTARQLIVIRVPDAVLEETDFPAVLDPIIGPERDTSTAFVGPVGYLETAPTIARGATGWFVAWSDTRNGRRSDVYGTRIADNGTVVDTRGIRVVGAAQNQSEVALSAHGDGWLAVWTDERSGGKDIFGAFVSGAGLVSPANGFAIASTGADETSPAAASDGTTALVLWSVGGDVQAARIEGEGTVVPLGAISASGATELRPALALDPSPGGRYLAVWEDSSVGLRGARLTRAGALVDATPLDVSAAPGLRMFPSVAWNGTSWVVAFSRQFSNFDVRATRVAADGTLLDPSDGVVLAVSAENQWDAAVSCDGPTCLLTWQRGPPRAEDIVGRRFDATLAPIGAELNLGAAARGQTTSSSAAAPGGGWLVTFEDGRGGGLDIFAARVSSSGALLDGDGFLAGLGFNRQSAPVIGATDNGFLVAWSDSESTAGNRIRARRFNAVGLPAGSDEATLVGGAAGGGAFNPAISREPIAGVHLIAWEDTRVDLDSDVFASRVSATGSPLDAQAIQVARTALLQGAPAVANGIDRWLVLWQDRRGGGAFDIYGALISTNGAVLANDIAISTADSDQVVPQAVWDDSAQLFFAVWMDTRAPSGDRDIYGARVTAAGTVLDADGVLVNGVLGLQEAPRLAAAEGLVAVAYADQRDAGNRDIFLTRLRLSVAGVNIVDASGVQICGAPNTQSGIAITANERGFGVAWTDRRKDGIDGDIYGATVAFDGTVSPVNGDPLAESPVEESSATVGSAPSSNPLGYLAYGKRRPDLETDRVEVRVGVH